MRMMQNIPTRGLSQSSPQTTLWEPACFQETNASIEQFLEVTNLLLEQVQLNSTHLFRADILFDSASELQTLKEKEARHARSSSEQAQAVGLSTSLVVTDPPQFEGYRHGRTVVRCLVPRKPQLDRPLNQSCFVYRNDLPIGSIDKRDEALVVYQPHCQSEDEMPWYHPKVRALAYLYTQREGHRPVISVYYSPFPSTLAPVPDRLERTFQSLLKTMIRLLVMPSKESQSASLISSDITSISLAPAALKDSILPQHIVQNTYTRLKQTYAPDLISRWVEKTEPSKHVFEDLSIAAFLIELWNNMYDRAQFPGFVDIACGNGVLVYILIKEGFTGMGFDARQRKTWEVLDMDDVLHEQVCIPQPFLEEYPKAATALEPGMSIHNGIFPSGTFIISNHADELTCWTPILSALSSPHAPLPFLAIPCCSHALDGSRRRYALKDVVDSTKSSQETVAKSDTGETLDDQPAVGDLRAVREMKQKATGEDKSMYACLTRKTASLAQELGCDVELTLMRIPSTRNIGIVGNRKQNTTAGMKELSIEDGKPTIDTMDMVRKVVERECSATGGVEASAQTWIEKTRKLQGGQGRGKVNWNNHVSSLPVKAAEAQILPVSV